MQRAAARRWRLPLAGWRARLFAGYWLRSTCPQSSEGRSRVGRRYAVKGPGPPLGAKYSTRIPSQQISSVRAHRARAPAGSY